MHADVVIVGAGAAGCVLATRLSERSSRSVVLLEAGPDVARIGGWPALRDLVVARGEPADYDEWERDYGCVGWSWRDVRPWFRRVPVALRRPRRRELGPIAADLLATDSSVQLAQLLSIAGLRPQQRRNLQVRVNAPVDRVVLCGQRAVAVRLTSGEEIEATTVVVSAGALQSPNILMRSGVARDGIGRNLHDHPSIAMTVPTLAVARPTTLPMSVVLRTSHVDDNDIQVIPYESAEGNALLAGAMRVYSRGGVLNDDRDLALLRAAAATAARLAGVEVDTSDRALLGADGAYRHAAGSCRMGSAADTLAVVDTSCRVIGYQSLIVCDASVIPNLPRSNPYLPIAMIATRIAATDFQ